MKKRVLFVLVLALFVASSAGAQENLKNDVVAERAKVDGQPSPAQLVEILNAVAWKHREAGWGLSRKDGGNRCSHPTLAVGNIACDVLHHRPTNTIVDVLGSAEAGAHPQWLVHGPMSDPKRPWVAPVDPGVTAPLPDPDPEPEPGGVAIAPLLLKLVALLEQIRDAQVAERAAMDAQTLALKAAIAELQAQVRQGVRIRF